MAYEFWEFIGHPSDQPLQTRCLSPTPPENIQPRYHPVSGIRIPNINNFPTGSVVEVCTRVQEKELCFRGVIHSVCEEDQSQVIIAFSDSDEAFKARMTEQLCHIASYRKQQVQLGRQLSDQEAAQEWISNYSPMFPKIDILPALH
jgi:hypothetical protein